MRRRSYADTMAIQTTHRGKTIYWHPDLEVWVADKLGFENAKLSAVKKQIDNLDRKQRKPMVDALWIKNGYWDHDPSSVIRVTVTVLTDDGDAWVQWGEKERHKVRLRELAPLDCETDARAWLSLDQTAKKAKKTAELAIERIRRYDADSLMLAAKEKETAS